MRMFGNPSLVILYLFFILCMSNSTKAQTPPERDIKALGDIDPFEVTLYGRDSYREAKGKWRLQPGMRMLRIPKLDYRPESILLGDKVGALLFPNHDFFSDLIEPYHDYSNKNIENWYHVPFFVFGTTRPTMGYRTSFHSSSLIIHRKDIGDILGVYLRLTFKKGQFYPLPDNGNDSAIIYHCVPEGYSRRLRIVPGGNGQGYLYPPTSHPNLLYDIQITVKCVNGKELFFPKPNDNSIEFDVCEISSLKLVYKGPFDRQDYLNLPPKTHRAPPAMTPHEFKVITPQKTDETKDMDTGTKPHFNLSDTDRPGNNYRNFDLPKPDPNLCLEACQKESRCKAFTYVKPGVQGPKARCWLKDAIPSEKPSDCCISGVKR